MVDLSTEYLGLKLKNPLVPSSSPFSKDLDRAKLLEDAGASALVMYSLFEEQIEHESRHMDRFLHQQSIGFGEADSFHPMPDTISSHEDDYLDQLQRLKSSLEIPIIASLNGTTMGGWIEHARALEQAGADALELNVYYIAADAGESAEQVEGRYLEILTGLRDQVDIPIAMKLSPQFSALVDFVKKLEVAGASGVSIFNRFYQPDINLETLEVAPKLELSTSIESLLRIRWTAILHGQVGCSLAVTGGLHTSEDVLKALLAGADVAHLCSVLLKQGPEHLSSLLEEMTAWMEEFEYESVQQLKGSISRQHAIDPAAYERANYISVLDSYSHPAGVLR
jgi:dihydroorotate dehydrogenase (fumarate)